MDYLDFKKIGFDSNFFWYRARRGLIKIILEKYKVRDKKILEIGCGVGGQLQVLSSLDNEVFGSDVNKEALDEASKLGFKVFYQDAEKELGESEKYDVICAFDVLEHIKDDSLALKNIGKALKKDGLLIFSVPAFQFLYSGHDIYMGHHRRYSMRDLRQKLVNNDFQIIKIFYWNFFLFPLAFFSRVVFKKKTIKSDVQKIPKLLNFILLVILFLENFLIKIGLRFPCGVSIFGVAKKRDIF